MFGSLHLVARSDFSSRVRMLYGYNRYQMSGMLEMKPFVLINLNCLYLHLEAWFSVNTRRVEK